MTRIKTWADRCEEHPEHQDGMITYAMIQARMQEEIDELRSIIPTSAIRCEAVVEHEGWSYDNNSYVGALYVELPAALIGKTVEVWIIPKEDV